MLVYNHVNVVFYVYTGVRKCVVYVVPAVFCVCYQSKLIRLFSRMLIAKSKLRLHAYFSELEAFPNTNQWLHIVGFTDSTLRVSIALFD